jgi:hypothetical protein
MPLQIPANTPYQSPLVALPSNWDKTPAEGRQQMAAEIPWGSMGGAGKTVSISVGNDSVHPFSRIAAITVDNSASGADAQFIFPDSGQTVTVPAYQQVTFPVYSRANMFYVSAPKSLSVDVTRFVMHNTLPPPSAIPPTTPQSLAISAAVPVTSTASFQLNAAGSANGTLVGLQIAIFQTASVAWTSNIIIQDGTGAIIAQCVAGAALPLSAVLYRQPDLNVRFSAGLFAVIASTGGPTGNWIVKGQYRTP